MSIRLSAIWNTLVYVCVSILSGVVAIIFQTALHSNPIYSGLQLLFGLIFIAIGAFTRFAAIKQFNYETINFSPKMKPQRFFSTGIYSQSRNPMYLGIVLMYFGVALLFGSWMMLIFTLIVFLILNSRIQKEEKLMETKFKDYIKYENTVRRWL